MAQLGGTGEPRWWRRGRDLAQAATREAAGTAAQLLIELDKVQGEAAEGVALATALEPGSAGQRLAAAWVPARDLADAAVQGYMSTVGGADLDADPEEAAARQADAEFRRVSDQMRAAIDGVQQFTSRWHEALQHARNVHANVPVRLQSAQSAVATAATAITTAQQAGQLAREATGLLEQARSALAPLTSARSGLGLRQLLEGADRVIELAREAQADAEALPERSRSIAHKITAARTFGQVTEAHLQAVPAQLSELRRSFVYTSFADVENAPELARAALQRADPQLDRVAALTTPREQRWAEGEATLAAARREIETAAAAIQAVGDRLEALHAAEHDPNAAISQTRRVLRDAQRFVLAGPERPAPQHISRLDALGAQLDGAPTRLAARNRPDYWAYLQELAAVRAGAAAVVAAVRQARAGQH